MPRPRGFHAPENDDEWLEYMIDDWLDRTELGEQVSTAELCKDRPDLLARLEASIALVRDPVGGAVRKS